MRHVYFVRHGETDLNREHKAQGRIDTHGLNDNGRAQAKALVDFVASRSLRGDAVISSPLRRAVETAEPLAAHLGKDISTDERLQEMYFGELEGMEISALKALVFDPPHTCPMPDGSVLIIPDGQTLRTHHASMDPKYDNLAHPGGESKAEACDRVCEAVFEHLKTNDATKNLWVVCHGAILRFVMGRHTPADQHLEGGVQNGSVLHFTWDPAKPEALEWQGVLHAQDDALGIKI